jgi:hypothetical protein
MPGRNIGARDASDQWCFLAARVGKRHALRGAAHGMIDW